MMKTIIAFPLLAAASTPRPVLIDTDPGGDDFLALVQERKFKKMNVWACAAHKRGDINLVGVTTVPGNNANPVGVYHNAYRVMNYFGCNEVPVGLGELHPDAQSDNFFGADGLWGLAHLMGDCDGGKCYESAAANSADLIIQNIEKYGRELVILAVGPLTNLALAESKKPTILQSAKEIALMGGSFTMRGNVAALAEYNIWFDSKSAHQVFEKSGLNNIVMFPLDVTEHICLNDEHLRKIGRWVPENGHLKHLISNLFEKGLKQNFDWGQAYDCFVVHDLSAVAYLLYPDIYTFRRTRVFVDSNSIKGKTYSDDRLTVLSNNHEEGLTITPNTWVAATLDSDKLAYAFTRDMVWFFPNVGPKEGFKSEL